MTFWLIVIAGLLFWIALEIHDGRPKKPSYGGWSVFLLTAALCIAAVLS